MAEKDGEKPKSSLGKKVLMTGLGVATAVGVTAAGVRAAENAGVKLPDSVKKLESEYFPSATEKIEMNSDIAIVVIPQHSEILGSTDAKDKEISSISDIYELKSGWNNSEVDQNDYFDALRRMKNNSKLDLEHLQPGDTVYFYIKSEK